MAKCGVNVPPGLTITTEVCQEFYRVGEWQQIPYAAVAVAACCTSCANVWHQTAVSHQPLALVSAVLILSRLLMIICLLLEQLKHGTLAGFVACHALC
jgi:phosphoenolpyruvate synthase/pyruvate phosphate dikinase